MSTKKETKKVSSGKLSSELWHIFKDITFVYKNFIHWSFSRVLISFWGIMLGILVALPIFLLGMLLGVMDGINWLDIVKYSVNGEDPEHSGFILGVASHPYSLVVMIFVMLTSIFAFMLASMYGIFLLSRLSLKYIGKKKLAYKKNLYFSRKYITTFIALFCWNAVYFLAITFIWLSVSLGLYLLYRGGFVSFDVLSFILGVAFVVFLGIISYVAYRILFGYVILADTRKNYKLKPARLYLQKSIKITQNKGFVKFLIIALLYASLMIPFDTIGTYMQDQVASMKDALAFKTGLVSNIAPEEMKYYEYITAEYSEMSDDEIISRIVFFSRIRILYFFIQYFLFSGLFILIITSFYKRVLVKK